MGNRSSSALNQARQEAAQARQELILARQQAQQAIAAAQEEAKRTQKAEKDAAEAKLTLAEQRLEEARKAKQLIETALLKGERPMKKASPEQIQSAKKLYNFQDGHFHVAITGTSGGGKSSLINSLRGLLPAADGAAKVGVTETTTDVQGYADPNPNTPYMWYDVPGCGTQDSRSWTYFDDKQLYAFDGIVVVVNERVLEDDIHILKSCQEYGISSFVVRSKSEVRVEAMMRDAMEDEDDETWLFGGKQVGRAQAFQEAKQIYSDISFAELKRNLVKAGLRPQGMYMVSSTDLRRIVKGRRPPPDQLFDEQSFMRDLLGFTS